MPERIDPACLTCIHARPLEWLRIWCRERNEKRPLWSVCPCHVERKVEVSNDPS